MLRFLPHPVAGSIVKNGGGLPTRRYENSKTGGEEIRFRFFFVNILKLHKWCDARPHPP
jgi:hypothetical protein